MEPNRGRPVYSINLSVLHGIAACMLVVFFALLVFQLASFNNPYLQAFDSSGLWQQRTLLLLVLSGAMTALPYACRSGTALGVTLPLAKAASGLSAHPGLDRGA